MVPTQIFTFPTAFKSPNFQQEMDVTLSGNIIDKTNEASFKVMRVSIPTLNEKDEQHITEDPLTQLEYSIAAEDGTTGNISIKKKYWINNGPLNMSMHGHGMHMNHVNM